MWNKTTYPFLVQALCIIPLKSIRMWASFPIFASVLNKNNKMRAKTILLLLIALLFTSVVSAQTRYPKREFRGAWIQCVNGQFQGMPAEEDAAAINKSTKQSARRRH